MPRRPSTAARSSPKKRAAPPSTSTMRRLNTDVSIEDYTAFQKGAAAEGMSLSAWVRMLCRKRLAERRPEGKG